MRNLINYSPGDWVDVREGIGQVVFSNDLYIESWMNHNNSLDGNDGEYQDTIIVYKILCDYSGKLRKRNIYSSATSKLCGHASQESLSLIYDMKDKESSHLEKFLNNKYDDNKPIGCVHNIAINISSENREELMKSIEEFSLNNHDLFGYLQLEAYLNQNGFNLNSMRVHESRGLDKEDKTIIQLFNKSYITKNNKRMFSSVRLLD